MRESLFWVSRSHFFISVYGAGLAKYRWVCNKPGLLLTGEWNLRHREDLRIYESDQYMEAPEMMTHIKEHEVRDELNAELLQRPELHADGSVANFHVDLDAVFREFRNLLRMHAPVPSAPGKLGSRPG